MSGLLYAVVQQNYRTSLNDPQIQISEDIAAGLSEGRSLNQFNQQVDISKSLASFIIVYDDTGKPVASSGALDGKVPVPPNGVLEYTRQHKEDRISWEPKPGVRSAIVINRFATDKASGFVLVGRSMKEVEARQSRLLQMIGAGLVVTLLVSFALDFVGDFWRQRAMVANVNKKEETVDEVLSDVLG